MVRGKAMNAAERGSMTSSRYGHEHPPSFGTSYRFEKDRSLSLVVAKRIMEGGEVGRIGMTQEV